MKISSSVVKLFWQYLVEMIIILVDVVTQLKTVHNMVHVTVQECL